MKVIEHNEHCSSHITVYILQCTYYSLLQLLQKWSNELHIESNVHVTQSNSRIFFNKVPLFSFKCLFWRCFRRLLIKINELIYIYYVFSYVYLVYKLVLCIFWFLFFQDGKLVSGQLAARVVEVVLKDENCTVLRSRIRQKRM